MTKSLAWRQDITVITLSKSRLHLWNHVAMAAVKVNMLESAIHIAVDFESLFAVLEFADSH